MPAYQSPVIAPWKYPASSATPTGSNSFTGNSGSVNSGYAGTDPTAPVTANLLDPNWGPAQYDTEKRGAELAVAGGYSGSPLAGYQTGRMRAADIERRAGLANELLSGETNRKLGVGAQANQVSQYGSTLAENQRQFNTQESYRQQQLLLQQQEAARVAEQQAWQHQQDLLKNQAASGYRYGGSGAIGGSSYNPLPQYLNSNGGGRVIDYNDSFARNYG